MDWFTYQVGRWGWKLMDSEPSIGGALCYQQVPPRQGIKSDQYRESYGSDAVGFSVLPCQLRHIDKLPEREYMPKEVF